MPPFFSIIIPTYNRERLITRAINSCLNQEFKEFEIIVVDDASTDRSLQVVQEFKDPRIILLKHESNRERLIARNNGARSSKGQWLVWFDSDDELVADALVVMKRRIDELPAGVLALRFMCRLDSGRISPDPPHCNEIWDYEAYIRWVEAHHGRWSESLPVVNRQTIQSVLFPEDRFYTGETQYHLDIASRYKVKACVDVVRLYHSDAENNTGVQDISRMLEAAPVFAARLESILSTHGKFLARWAPKTYKMLYSGHITQLLLSGQRKKAWVAFLKAFGANALILRASGIMMLGLLNPTLLANAKIVWSKKVYHRI